jgi:hypothetical protein
MLTYAEHAGGGASLLPLADSNYFSSLTSLLTTSLISLLHFSHLSPPLLSSLSSACPVAAAYIGGGSAAIYLN